MKKVAIFLKHVVFVLLLVLTVQSHAGDMPYDIVDGQVDKNTFQGWQIYQDVKCGGCHGDSGQADAPFNLVERLKTISREQFVNSVIRGYGLMPPFITNHKVVDNIDKIYAYLKARSDGALGVGKPYKR